MHFAFVWELGSGLAHLTLGIPILKELSWRGHRVSLVGPDLSAAASLLSRSGIALVHTRPIQSRDSWRSRNSFPQLLLDCGFDDPRTLAMAITYWKGVVASVNADFLILDHAPTVALAIRESGLRHAFVGHGFFIPPLETPMPLYWTDRPEAIEHAIRDEERALTSCNVALRACRLPEIESVSSIFANGLRLLTTYPQLDIYSRRENPPYWGPQPIPSTGEIAKWPAAGASGRKVYAYLRSSEDLISRIIACCRNADATFFISSTIRAVRRHKDNLPPNVALSSEFVNVRRVVSESDLVVSHGGIGTLSAALALGKPTLNIPSQMEQYLLSKRIASRQLGGSVNVKTVDSLFCLSVIGLLADDGMRRRCTQFTRENGGVEYLDSQPVRIGARLVEELLH